MLNEYLVVKADDMWGIFLFITQILGTTLTTHKGIHTLFDCSAITDALPSLETSQNSRPITTTKLHVHPVTVTHRTRQNRGTAV